MSRILPKCALATPEVAEWFRTELGAAVNDQTAYRRRQSSVAWPSAKRNWQSMQNRLLDAYLAGMVEDVVYKAKSKELTGEAAKTDDALARAWRPGPGSQRKGQRNSSIGRRRAAEIWRGSNNAVRREILNAVCLNRTLTDVTLDASKEKALRRFRQRARFLTNSRGDWI